MSYRVSRSKIHGVGVFAHRNFKKGDVVGQMTVQFVGYAQYFTELPSTGILDKSGMIFVPLAGFPLWFTNYSTDPNIGATTEGDVVALRDISMGEELTVVSAHVKEDVR